MDNIVDIGGSYERHDLPQLPCVQDVIEFLDENGISYREEMVRLDDIIPSQRQVNIDKINDICLSLENGQTWDLVLSADYELIDAHHRLLSMIKTYGLEKEINCLIIELSLIEIISIYNLKGNAMATKKTINEDTAVQDERERQKRELDQIKRAHFDRLQKAREDDFDEKRVKGNLNEAADAKTFYRELVSQIKAMDRNALMSWGAKDPVLSNTSSTFTDSKSGKKIMMSAPYVTLKVRGSKHKGFLVIGLSRNDTYTIVLLAVRGTDLKIVDSATEVYVDMLVPILDELIG